MKDIAVVTGLIRRAVVLLLALSILVHVSGCTLPEGDSRGQKRGHMQGMAEGSLAKLNVYEPGTRELIAASPGYAVFDAVQTQVLIASAGNGYGLVHNNRTGEDHYMSAFGLGAGLGAGIKSQRIIIVFENEQVLNRFVHEGWVFGASGTATAAAANVERETETNTIFKQGMRIYTFTDDGLMAGVELRGGRVWRDKKLN